MWVVESEPSVLGRIRIPWNHQGAAKRLQWGLPTRAQTVALPLWSSLAPALMGPFTPAGVLRPQRWLRPKVLARGPLPNPSQPCRKQGSENVWSTPCHSPRQNPPPAPP